MWHPLETSGLRRKYRPIGQTKVNDSSITIREPLEKSAGTVERLFHRIVVRQRRHAASCSLQCLVTTAEHAHGVPEARYLFANGGKCMRHRQANAARDQPNPGCCKYADFCIGVLLTAFGLCSSAPCQALPLLCCAALVNRGQKTPPKGMIPTHQGEGALYSPRPCAQSPRGPLSRSQIASFCVGRQKRERTPCLLNSGPHAQSSSTKSELRRRGATTFVARDEKMVPRLAGRGPSKSH